MTVGRILMAFSKRASQEINEAGAYLWFHEATASDSPFPWIGCWSIVGLPPSAFRSSVFIDNVGGVTPMSTTHCSIGWSRAH